MRRQWITYMVPLVGVLAAEIEALVDLVDLGVFIVLSGSGGVSCEVNLINALAFILETRVERRRDDVLDSVGGDVRSRIVMFRFGVPTKKISQK